MGETPVFCPRAPKGKSATGPMDDVKGLPCKCEYVIRSLSGEKNVKLPASLSWSSRSHIDKYVQNKYKLETDLSV